MARTPWRFVDPVTTTEYVWPVNPNNDSGSNTRSKQFAYTAVAGSRRNNLGQHTVDTLIHQSNVNQSSFSYDGIIYDTAHYGALESWANKEYPVELWDDLNRGYLVYITKFSPARIRSTKTPFKHSYTISGIILGEL